MEDNFTGNKIPESGGRKGPRTRLILAAIIAVGMALRIGVAMYGLMPPPDKSFRAAPDAHDYYYLAKNLSEYHSFGKDADRTRPNGDHVFFYHHSEIFRTPGYPAFEAAIMKSIPQAWLDRLRPSEGNGVISNLLNSTVFPILLVQIMLDWLLIGLTFWLGTILASRGVGLLAAAMQAVSPLAIGACCMPLSDSLFALIFTAGLIMLAKFLKSDSWLMLVDLAFTMAAGCYVRPVGLVLSAIIALAIIFIHPQRRQKNNPANPNLKPDTTTRRNGIGIRLARAMVFAAIIAACLVPWVIRNIKVADYAGFSSFATDSLFKFSASRIEAEKAGKDWQDVYRTMEWQIVPDWRHEHTPGELARARAAKAWQVVLDNPGRAVALHLKGDVAFFLPGGSDVLQLLDLTKPNRGTLDVIRTEGIVAGLRNYFGDSSAAMLAAVPMLLFFLIQIVGLAWCAIKKLRLSMPAFAWIALLLVAASALLPGPCNHPRFRVPFEPIINIAAAIGLLLFLTRRKRSGKASAPVAPNSSS